MTSKAENARTSLRRMARHEESEFSNASILNSMEKFVRTVSEMEDTILVPSRLMDLAVGDSNDTISEKIFKNGQNNVVKDTLVNTDLYRLYTIINNMKVELLWSQENPSDNSQMEDQVQERIFKEPTPATKCHTRCPSTASIKSLHSASSVVSSSSSDSDSDIGLENDSGIENEDTAHDRLANLAADKFRRHLRGLHRCLNHMTETAEYLTLRYQADVGGQV